MKVKKLIALLAVFSLALMGCSYKNWFGKRPSDQPNTKWVSEDQSVYIEIDQHGQGTGYALINGERIDFLFECAGVTIELFSTEAKDRIGLYPEERYERWIGSFERMDCFTANVEETTFFAVDQTLTFHKTSTD